jgi:hypothetical protein
VLPLELEDKLLDYVAATYWSSELWVDTMYPWGERGTFLEKWDGPDVWQRRALQVIDEQLVKIARAAADPVYAAQLERSGQTLDNTIRMAVSSGHGVGKTALISWIIHWFMSTRPNPQVVATAGTKNQLTTKTWREVKKWLDVCLVGHWFEWAQTSLQLKEAPTWKANAIPWSEHQPQNFAGTHEDHVLYLFDEASTISNAIWETSEGAFTTQGPHIWLAFGNPEQATGRFRECWGFRRKYWITFEVDARDSKLSNKALIKQWIEQYGIDSDFIRVRVLGRPPRTGPSQMIGTDLVERAEERCRTKEVEPKKLLLSEPRIMGVDPAGGDSEHSAETVILLRQGALLFPDIVALREPDGMKVASEILHYIGLWKPDMVFMDAHGLGKPIYDRLVQLGQGHIVIPCYAGDDDCLTGDDKLVYYNNRILWWARMKEWLSGGAIPYHARLREDLLAPRRYYNLKQRMLLESKDDMALRGVQSPDYGDALAHTFAQPVPRKHGDEGGGDVEPENP